MGSRAAASASAQVGPQTLCLWEFAFTLVFFFFFYQISASVFVCFFVLIFSYFPLCWVLVAVHGLSLVAVSRGYSRVAMCGLLIAWLLLLQSMALGHEGFSSCSSRAQWLWHIR